MWEKMKGRKRDNDQTRNRDIETDLKEIKKRKEKVILKKFRPCLYFMPT